MPLQASIDISMYPLQDQYCQPIIDFIESLEKRPDIRIARNAMSTQIFGDYRTLMAALTDDIETVLADQPKTVFVLKLLGTDRSEADIERCGD
ncbi:hypothetical protein [Thiomicrospira sp. S5]|uniref:hypothetical protein n=1 Tax=Thiomicrospira sp. S5 TaxID=1803865 RepID=UPI000F8EB791|nr:hypothetical protein [Thiomicrospira sp. S5]